MASVRVLSLGYFLLFLPEIASFSSPLHRQHHQSTSLKAFQLPTLEWPKFNFGSKTPSNVNNNDQEKLEKIKLVKDEIVKEIEPTNYGLSLEKGDTPQINDLLSDLESKCMMDEPARSDLMGGNWIVEYTDAPPPSNGRLFGPLQGRARQIINLEEKTYVNYLSIPGDDLDKEWLSATLAATFEEWNGEFLKDDRMSASSEEAEAEDSASYQSDSNEDYGANSWKVDFKTLTLKLFGQTLIKKEFDGTSRIWKMTYLDEETRIVRAGRTGKDEDNMVFYMSREKN